LIYGFISTDTRIVKIMKFLFLEPFFGGSHKDFAEGLVTHSRHDIELITLPARFWKWRMRGATLHFYNLLPALSEYDGIISSALMSLSDFKMLAGADCPPALVYFHENQLTYPLAPGEAMDMHFGFTDITTCLAANRILFNSKTHLNHFFKTLPGFLKKMPEFRPHWVTEAIRKKAGTLYPGCHFPAAICPRGEKTELPPLIIWNHRWEFDKNPQDFFDALEAISRKGIDFRLALLGENFQTIPPPFVKAKDHFKNQIVQYGYVPSKEAYHDWLRKGDIVISTAQQENFGISIVEAIRYGCLPLLPNRLAYPEILPKAFHVDFLYQDQADLIRKLASLLTQLHRFSLKRQTLMQSMEPHAWENRIAEFDLELANLTLTARVN
jgi:glycosyltransferase involved in cell wall biosynthesis